MPSQIKIRIFNSEDLPPEWCRRAQALDESVEKDVKIIINEVKKNGDKSLIEFTKRFDKANLKPENLRVKFEEIQAAYNKVTKEQVKALRLMKEKVNAVEKLTIKEPKITITQEGMTICDKVFPIESVGCYVPGGKAAYPSTVIMTTVPAKTAGVPRILVCSPPDKNGDVNPLVLVASDICGVTEVYKVGGVQAIAALAYGTETIKPVRKIVGPGNKYVTMAKILVSKDVTIDMPAGPSEVLLLADNSANPKFVAADMISQAEHGGDSVAGLITTSKKLATEVVSWLKKMSSSAERKEIIQKSLQTYGFIIICNEIEEMINLANTFASEHVEIMIQNPMELVSKITSAGLILIGPNSPVALSDYGSGTNHVLPTGGFAHAYSGLSALDFVRRVNVVDCSKDELLKLNNYVRVLSEAENLPSHYKAVAARFEE